MGNPDQSIDMETSELNTRYCFDGSTSGQLTRRKIKNKSNQTGCINIENGHSKWAD